MRLLVTLDRITLDAFIHNDWKYATINVEDARQPDGNIDLEETIARLLDVMI